MKSLIGVMVWLAREAFWKYRWVVKEGAKVTPELFPSVWIEVLKAWLPRSGGGGLVGRTKDVLGGVDPVLGDRSITAKGTSFQAVPQSPTAPRACEAAAV